LPVPLVENAPAKVNLTLRVFRRRDDGYHEIESLVAFADFGDSLGFSRGGGLSLTLRGSSAADAGEGDDNLVLKAARALAANRSDIVLGAFHLDKRLPVAAGLGGGSADAAAALRLIARANGIPLDDPGLYAAARSTGADVPVCLDPRPRIMRGIGEVLSAPLSLPALPVVLVNPGTALPTKAVFAGWKPGSATAAGLDAAAIATVTDRDELLRLLAIQSNDLEAPAIALKPIVADALEALRGLPGCALARMSGSGATCFGIFDSPSSASEGTNILRANYPNWWVQAGALGDGRK
jgi:4-diphosphocytidyl-2-C-methyl-D-erythritol kinase